MDTNPLAAGYGNMPANPAQPQLPDYLKQTNNPTMAGAANNMVRALLAGLSQQKKPGLPDGDPMVPGAPTNINAPASDFPSGGTSGVPYLGGFMNAPGMPGMGGLMSMGGGSPFGGSGNPMMSALFKQPPSSDAIY